MEENRNGISLSPKSARILQNLTVAKPGAQKQSAPLSSWTSTVSRIYSKGVLDRLKSLYKSSLDLCSSSSNTSSSPNSHDTRPITNRTNNSSSNDEQKCFELTKENLEPSNSRPIVSSEQSSSSSSYCSSNLSPTNDSSSKVDALKSAERTNNNSLMIIKTIDRTAANHNSKFDYYESCSRLLVESSNARLRAACNSGGGAALSSPRQHRKKNHSPPLPTSKSGDKRIGCSGSSVEIVAATNSSSSSPKSPLTTAEQRDCQKYIRFDAIGDRAAVAGANCLECRNSDDGNAEDGVQNRSGQSLSPPRETITYDTNMKKDRSAAGSRVERSRCACALPPNRAEHNMSEIRQVALSNRHVESIGVASEQAVVCCPSSCGRRVTARRTDLASSRRLNAERGNDGTKEEMIMSADLVCCNEASTHPNTARNASSVSTNKQSVSWRSSSSKNLSSKSNICSSGGKKVYPSSNGSNTNRNDSFKTTMSVMPNCQIIAPNCTRKNDFSNNVSARSPRDPTFSPLMTPITSNTLNAKHQKANNCAKSPLVHSSENSNQTVILDSQSSTLFNNFSTPPYSPIDRNDCQSSCDDCSIQKCCFSEDFHSGRTGNASNSALKSNTTFNSLIDDNWNPVSYTSAEDITNDFSNPDQGLLNSFINSFEKAAQQIREEDADIESIAVNLLKFYSSMSNLRLIGNAIVTSNSDYFHGKCLNPAIIQYFKNIRDEYNTILRLRGNQQDSSYFRLTGFDITYLVVSRSNALYIFVLQEKKLSNVCGYSSSEQQYTSKNNCSCKKNSKKDLNNNSRGDTKGTCCKQHGLFMTNS